MDLTSSNARSIAYHVVADWLSQKTGIPGTDIDITKKFDDYGLTDGAWLDMCNDITATINRATSRAMILDG